MAFKHMITCSISLVTGKCQVKTTIRQHIIPTRMAIIKKITRIGEDVEKLQFSYIAGRNIKWHSTATLENSVVISQKV